MSELSVTSTSTTSSTLTFSVETHYVETAAPTGGPAASVATFSVSDRPGTMIVAVAAHLVNTHPTHDWQMGPGSQVQWSHDGQTATALLADWLTDGDGNVSSTPDDTTGQIVQLDITLATLA